MQDFHTPDQGPAPGHDPFGVSHFASQVVSILADRSTRAVTVPQEALVASLTRASLSGEAGAFAELLGEMRRARITLACLADVYIPMAARRMGEAWHEDRMSWIDVSIGVARLQALLREIGTAWAADQAQDGGLGTVLMVLPQNEQHTLGAMVAVGQLRRYGLSVCLRMAPSRDELRSLIMARDFDGIMISVGTEEKLTAVARTVAFVRGAQLRPAPIIIGGAVTQKVGDAASCTGADHCCSDVEAALEAMGFRTEAQGVLKRA